MSEQSQEHRNTEKASPDEPENHGSLSVEDDPDGTVSPAGLAGSASKGDASIGYHPSSTEADERQEG